MRSKFYYCGYQERYHSEVKEKLYTLGISAEESDEIILTLIEENWLDEERFALAYAIGKFNTKQWGRIKIKHALLQKRVKMDFIDKALIQINRDEYERCLKKLAEEKYDLLKNEQYLIRKKKTIDYLIQKGYEPELIGTIINMFQQKK